MALLGRIFQPPFLINHPRKPWHGVANIFNQPSLTSRPRPSKGDDRMLSKPLIEKEEGASRLNRVMSLSHVVYRPCSSSTMPLIPGEVDLCLALESCLSFEPTSSSLDDSLCDKSFRLLLNQSSVGTESKTLWQFMVATSMMPTSLKRALDQLSPPLKQKPTFKRN